MVKDYSCQSHFAVTGIGTHRLCLQSGAYPSGHSALTCFQKVIDRPLQSKFIDVKHQLISSIHCMLLNNSQ